MAVTGEQRFGEIGIAALGAALRWNVQQTTQSMTKLFSKSDICCESHVRDVGISHSSWYEFIMIVSL
jgi:hypothetical protein